MLGKTNGGGGGFDPSEIQSGTIAVDNILGLDTLGSIVKGNLAGQYVRVIPAPASTTLTDELIDVFKEGVFVNGDFLGMTNPVFFPCKADEGNYYGIVIGAGGSITYVETYRISPAKVISVYRLAFYIGNTDGGVGFSNAISANNVNITGNLVVKSKSWPSYPTNNTTPKVLQIASNGGSLSWGDVPSPAVVAYEGTSLLPTDVVFEDWTLHRAIKDGNVLWFVVSGKIKNNGSASANVRTLCEITLPSELSAKIYRFEGTTCDEAYDTNSMVEVHAGYISSNMNTSFYLVSEVANKIQIWSYANTAINAGASATFDCRIPIFLNIGD